MCGGDDHLAWKRPVSLEVCRGLHTVRGSSAWDDLDSISVANLPAKFRMLDIERDPRGKFRPSWSGPYFIKELTLEGVAWLMDLDGNQFSEPTNVDQLKRSMAHGIHYTCCISYLRAWVSIIGYLSLVFLHFYHPVTLAYITSRVLRPPRGYGIRCHLRQPLLGQDHALDDG
ncbi:hypothetical protein CK203_054661 [Vitis vinifera]|uniref:Uncharacterized protein n=1 Tax=Vitis vinifera TaxID=29760 RepID=A0A438H8V0_VITVI|nr:hypothetical protein CK203_054661 [Vitis vinifera]